MIRYILGMIAILLIFVIARAAFFDNVENLRKSVVADTKSMSIESKTATSGKVQKQKVASLRDKKAKQNEAMLNKDKHEILESNVQEYTYTPIIFEEVSIDEIALDYPPRKNVTPLLAMRINSHIISNLKKQQALSIPLPEGLEYHFIPTSQSTKEQSVSFHDTHNDEGVSLSSTLTVDSNGSGYMLIQTSQGSYEVEFERGMGYIYDTTEIRRAMQDPKSMDDEILVYPKH